MNTLVYQKIHARRKRFIRRMLLSVAFLITAFAVAEWASATTPFAQVGVYEISKINDSCVAIPEFDGNVDVLAFGIHATGVAHVGFANESWKLSSGEKEGVRLEVDARGHWEGNAFVLEDHDRTFFMKVPFEFFKEVALGKVLRIEAGTWKAAFDLTNTHAMLKSLAQCAQSLRESGNPFEHKTIKDDNNPFVDL